VEPVWIAKQKGRYILLDGAHRLVATYLEGKRTVPAYIVHV
jgi:ParB-like chromosome segregation protein Spo0J